MNPLDAFRLDGKVAIVTGASGGLGRHFAEVLTAAGARVALVARRAGRLDAIAAELPGALAVPADLSVEADVDRVVETTVAALGRVDVLVNNAGVHSMAPAEHEPVADIRRVLDVDLLAPLLLARRAVGPMVDNGGGSVVNISSIGGIVGVPAVPQAAYAAAKGGLVNLTRELAAQWGPKGVRVNAIAPGMLGAMEGAEVTGDAADRIARRTPLRRLGSYRDVDGALLLLASDAGAFITGQTLVVDGGWTTV